MSVTSVARKGTVRVNENKRRSGYMTTTELARLCGVSRFTIINWTRQGRIKAIRTVGRHYRIPVSEALSLLRTFGKKEKPSSSNLKEPCQQQVPTTNGDEECGNCLTTFYVTGGVFKMNDFVSTREMETILYGKGGVQ